MKLLMVMELKLYSHFLSLALFFSLGSQALAVVSPQIGFESLGFVSSDYENTSEKTFSFISAAIKNQETQPSIFNIDLQARYAIGRPVLSYTHLRELYFYQESEAVNISYGRRLHSWSELEQAWDLGFFQPEFRWNPLEPSAQGLVGVFLDNQESVLPNSKEQNLRWTLFGSPLFIPDQGPGYELKQGQFSASNPWFNPPPQNIEFNGQILPIDYKVHVPDTNSVLFQSIYGAQLGYQTDSGFYFQAAAISKPSHQLALTYKAILVADRVKADIVPQIYREQNLSLDLGYKPDGGRFSLMILSNHPDEIVPESNYNYPEIKPSLSWGPQVQINGERFNFYGNGLFVNGGEVIDHGPDSGQIKSSLTSKYMLRSAYQVGASFNARWTRSMSFQSDLNWTESFKNALKRLKWSSQVRFHRSLSFYLNILLVSTDDQPEDVSASDVSHLQNLDQVLGGFSYEF